MVPTAVILVPDLDATTLQTALRRRRAAERAELRFRVPVVGRFDSALVPVKTGEGPPDRWLLAIDQALPLQDQVALYGHALGHLLLGREPQQAGQMLRLEPHEGYTHTDVLGELRLFETVRRLYDRRVLEAYPLLTELLGVRETPPIVDSVATDLRQRLAEAGWRGQSVELPYVFTNGRIFISGGSIRRGPKLRIDALLRVEASLPIAVVQMVRAGEAFEDAALWLSEIAHRRLAVPFAFLLTEDGTIHEFDWSLSAEPVQTTPERIPSRDELRDRWLNALGLSDNVARAALLYPYQLSHGKPRYYQEAAINRAVIAALRAKRGLRPPRILLTLATGTGKTKVAFQLAWKLKRSLAIRRILFLTDRDYLLSQAMDNEFDPFGDGRHRIQGEISTSRDMLFATYQALASDEYRRGLYRDYPSNFFDLIIIDECHRGSAQDDSNWRSILEYFRDAIQIGLTATPLRTDNVQTYEYFGQPIYSYSLRDGINDGFLAPYRVRRILMGAAPEAAAAPPLEADGLQEDTPGSVEEVGATSSEPTGATSAEVEETAASLRHRTTVIATHLAAFLRRTDSLAKTIVFCVDQRHADRMREALEQELDEEVARYDDYVERIVSDEGIEGKRALGRFSTPSERTPVVVTTSKLLTTGVDVPTCKNIVLARPINSMVEFKQIIGRGTRLYEPQKTWFTILDYAGATQLFFDPDFDGDPEVVELESLLPQPAPGTDVVENGPQPRLNGETGAASTVGEATPDPQDGRELSVQASGGNVQAADNERPINRPDPALPEATQIAGADAEAQPFVSGESLDAPSASDPTNVPGVSSPLPEQSRTTTPLPTVGASGAVIETTSDYTANSLDASPEAAPAGEPPAVPANLPVQPPVPQQPAFQALTGDGRVIQVVGEIMYELAPDGISLRSMSYRDYTVETLRDLVSQPADLHARWLRPEQRDEIRTLLHDVGVDLPALAQSLRMPEVDPLDLLLYVAFGQPATTRRERADRVRRERADFFARYSEPARAILDTILKKYIDGEAQDVSDTELLKVPPLSEQGTFIELAQHFGGGANVRATLRELDSLLYSA